MKDRKAYLTLNRPDRLNAIDVRMPGDTGRAFCSGYDLQTSAEDGGGTLWRSLKPAIAKVHGYAVAGGSDIALSCDLGAFVTARAGFETL